MAAKDNLSEQLHLFTPPNTDPVVDVSDWARQQQWHSSKESVFPEKDRDIPESLDELDKEGNEYAGAAGHPLGVHVGTTWSARERDTFIRNKYHPVHLQGEDHLPSHEMDTALDPDYGFEKPNLWNDDSANGAVPESTRAIRAGKNIPYLNDSEDRGSISYRAPRKNLSTWAESVMTKPDSTFAEREAVRKGTEIVYTPNRYRTRSKSRQKLIDNNDRPTVGDGYEVLPQPIEVPAPRGLTASPIDFGPEGRDAEGGLEATLIPRFTNPGRGRRRLAKEKAKIHKQENELTLDLDV
jgi:hypothetical protein